MSGRWSESQLMDFDQLPLVSALPQSEDEENAPVLILNSFTPKPFLEFPACRINDFRRLPLKISNPKDYSQKVDFKKCRTNKGFRLEHPLRHCEPESGSSLELVVPAGGSVIQYVSFTAAGQSGGNLRETWSCFVDYHFWLHINLIAKVLEEPKKKAKVKQVWKKPPKLPVHGRHKEDKENRHIPPPMPALPFDTRAGARKSIVNNGMTRTVALSSSHSNTQSIPSRSRREFGTVNTELNHNNCQDGDNGEIYQVEQLPTVDECFGVSEDRRGTYSIGGTEQNLHDDNFHSGKKDTYCKEHHDFIRIALKKCSSSEEPSIGSPLTPMSMHKSEKRTFHVPNPVFDHESDVSQSDSPPCVSGSSSVKSGGGGRVRRANVSSLSPCAIENKRNRRTLFEDKPNKTRSPMIAKSLANLRNSLKKKKRKSTSFSQSAIQNVNRCEIGIQTSECQWIERHEFALSQWLKSTLATHGLPKEPEAPDGDKKLDSCWNISELEPGLRESHPLRSYNEDKELNGLRSRLLGLRLSQEISIILRNVNDQIEDGRISIRSDKKVAYDLALKRDLLGLVMAFNPSWLRVGLEVVFGETFNITSRSCAVISHELSKFVRTRMISHPNIDTKQLSEYAMSSGGGIEALHRHILRTFFALVLLLDRSRLNKLIHHDPCLLTLKSGFKSTKELVVQFTRLCLRGEGSIVKHLGGLGYHLYYTQSALDEYDFTFCSIVTDVRDGVRLARATELAMSGGGGGSVELCTRLRVPADCRTRKLHNVNVTLEFLKSSLNLNSVSDFKGSEIHARDIVDGHREKTLALLWFVALNLQLESLVSQQEIQSEINRLKSILKRPFNETSDGCKVSDLLLQWTRIICLQFGFKRPSDFSGGFADGIALCLIISYYEPSLIDARQIGRMMEESQPNAQCALISTHFSRDERASFLQRYQSNLDVFRSALFQLGGVPDLIPDQPSFFLEDRTVTLLVGLLFRRLRDVGRECAAARVIQRCWRSYRNRWAHYDINCTPRVERDMCDYLPPVIAASQEIAHFSSDEEAASQLTLEEATVRIQRFWRAHKAMSESIENQFNRTAAEARIESDLSGVEEFDSDVAASPSLEDIQNLNSSVEPADPDMSAIQFSARPDYSDGTPDRQIALLRHTGRDEGDSDELSDMMSLMRDRISLIKGRVNADCRQTAARCIQRWFRARIVARDCRAQFMRQKRAIISIQTNFRANLLMRKERTRYQNLRKSVLFVQISYRSKKQRSYFLRLKSAVLFVERRYICMKAMRYQREDYLLTKSSAVTIQRFFRSSILAKETRQMFLAEKQAAIRIQRFFRSHIFAERAHHDFLSEKRAAICIQRYFRSHLLARRDRQNFLEQQKAAICIQRFFRSFLLTREIRLNFLAQKHAAISIQRYFKSYLFVRSAQQNFLAQKHAAISIQRYFRLYMLTRRIRQNFLSQKGAAICLQKHLREYRRKRRLEEFVISLQTSIRGYLTRESLMGDVNYRGTLVWFYRCAINWQLDYAGDAQSGKVVRMTGIYRQRLVLHSVIYIQRLRRAVLLGRGVRSSYCHQRRSVILIQSLVRAYLARVRFAAIRTAVIRIQSSFRGYEQRRKYQNYCSRVKSAVSEIERAYIGYKCRRDFHRARSSVILVQRAVRSHQSRKRAELHRRQCIAVQCIANWYHAIICSRRRRVISLQQHQASAIRIQAFWRGQRLSKLFLEKKNAALLIEGWYINCLVKRINRVLAEGDRLAKEEKMSSSIFPTEEVTPPTLPKGAPPNPMLAAMCDPLEYHRKLMKAVVMVQSSFRGYHLRRDLKYFADCVSVIQRSFRRYKYTKHPRTLFKAKRRAALCLQRFTRGMLVRRRVARQRWAVNVISVWYRANRHGYFKRKHIRNAATLIQSTWRGYRVRKEQDRRLTQICSNLNHMGSAGQSLTLAFRIDQGLHSLMKIHHVSKIMPVLSDIEVCTRWSLECCVKTARGGAVGVLLQLMERCARSVPDQEVMLAAVAILSNLAKVRETAVHLREDADLMQVLFNVLAKSGEHGAKLYCHTCFLMQILCQYRDCARQVKTNYREIERMRNQYRLAKAKQKNRAQTPSQALYTGKEITTPMKRHRGSVTVHNGGGGGGGGANNLPTKEEKHNKSVAVASIADALPEWHLSKTRVEPARNIMAAIRSLLVQIDVPFEK